MVTLAGVAVFISSLLAMWPVWGFLTIIYLVVIFFGSTFSLMFLPDGALGTLVFWVGLIVAGVISHTLPHDPVW